jgi:hypothetical protein
MKALAIIGLVMSGITWIVMAAYQTSDTNTAIGWGFLSVIYATAVYICVLVRMKEIKEMKNAK